MNGLKPPKQRVMPSMGSYKPRRALLNCAIPRRFLIRWRVLSIRCQRAASSCRGDTASCNCSSIVRACISTWHSVLVVNLHRLGGRRATIKAHPATPHHPRPYGKGISPTRMESLPISPWWLCENSCLQVSLQSCGGRLNALPSKSLLLRWYLDRLTCQGQVTGPVSRTSATTWSCSFARHVVNERQSL